MKKILILLGLIPTLLVAQMNKQHSIDETAKFLTGTWLLTIFEDSDFKAEQKIIHKVCWEITSKEGIVRKKKKKGAFVVKFAFDANGSGDYQECDSYQLFSKNRGCTEIKTCQPIPDLQYLRGEIVIHMTFMLGEDIYHILELTANKLIIENSKKQKSTFKRIE